MIRPLKKQNISDRVFEQLRDLIYRGDIAPGERMMAEREMAAMFRVGRPTVRNAIQRLIDQGLVISRRGVGTFVQNEGDAVDKKPLLQALNSEEFTITEIQEVRLGLECKSAELAANRASDQDVRKIMKIYEQMQEERAYGHIKTATDTIFHMNITYASKNIIQIHLMKNFYDLLSYAVARSYDKAMQAMDNDDIAERQQRQHGMIVEAIKLHDPVKARQAMEEHITTILEVCQEFGI